MDMFEKRLNTMQKRLLAWEMMTKKYMRENDDARMVMLCLTYRKVKDYRPGHIGQFTQVMRNKLNDQLLGWAWVAELQKRGAVHYHIAIMIKKNTDLPLPDKSGWWTHGITQIETITNIAYMLKYQGKDRQKELAKYPKGARLYGVSVRWGGKETKEVFRILAGMYKQNTDSQEWQYLGSSVNESYAKNVISRGKIV